MVEWKDISRFPATNLTWGVMKEGKIIASEEFRTKELAKAWTYFSSHLFTSPSTNRLLPAGLLPELEPGCRKKVVTSHMAALFVGIYTFCLCFFVFSGLFLAVPRQLSFIAGASLIFICFFIEVWLIKKYPHVFTERALYFNWIKKNSGIAWKVFAVIMIFFGSAQVIYQQFSILDHQMLRDYGVLFSYIDGGEYWRFFVGPLFHSNIIHWVSNFLWILLLFPLLGWIDSRLSVTLLYLSAVVSHIATYIAVRYGLAESSDGIAGISGMIFFAMGFVCANSLCYREFYPYKFYLSIIPLTLLNLLLSEFFDFNPNNSFEAHLSGLVFGFVIGILLNPLKVSKK